MTASIKTQIKCNHSDHKGQYGGRAIPRNWFLIKYARRGNHQYAIAVTALSNQINN